MAQPKHTNITTEDNYKKHYAENVSADDDEKKIEDTYFKIKSYHVSCQSYRPKSYDCTENLGGIVLYAVDGETDWKKNGVHCKTGYIILKQTGKNGEIYDNYGKEENINSDVGMIHGGIYESVFAESPKKSNVIGSGFSRCNGEWKYRSYSFNQSNDDYHDTYNKEMKKIESKWVAKAVKNWINNGQQTTIVNESGGGLVVHQTIKGVTISE